MTDASYPYDMTVVVPVYNATEYLRRCVASLDAQTASQSSFEVMLVNDGSVDDSLALCREVASTRPNYVVIDQVNRGVSAARNAGMRQAHGRYLMFLDPDDEISPTTVEGLVNSFESFGSSVDLVTYPLCYHDVQTGREHRNYRKKWLTETGVYDLMRYPFVSQTTINVCVKNEGPDTLLFDESRLIYEDQVFNTTLLERRCALGYCAEAEYKYYRSSTNTSSMRDRPGLANHDVQSAFELFCEMAQRNPHYARYAYSMILYNVGWRYRAGKLLSSDEGQARGELQASWLGRVLRRIPLSCWQESPFVSNTLMVRLLHECGLIETPSSISYGLDATTLGFANGTVIQVDNPTIVIDGMIRHGREIAIRGYVYGPTLVFESKPLLEAWVDDKHTTLALVESRCGETGSEEPLAHSWRFEWRVAIEQRLPCILKLALAFEGREVPSFDLVVDTVRCNGRTIDRNTKEFVDWRVAVHDGSLRVGTIKGLPEQLMPMAVGALKVRERFRHGGENYSAAQPIRRKLSKAQRQHSRPIWLYLDADPDKSRLLTQVMAEDSKTSGTVELLYLNLHASGNDEIAGAPNSIEPRSWEHIKAMLFAERIITTHRDVRDLLPCTKGVWDRIADYAVDQEYVLVADGATSISDTAFDSLRIVVEQDA